MQTSSLAAAPLNRRIAIGSLMLTVVHGSGRALGLLTLPWMTQFFAPDAFGAAALATTFISLLSGIALMGMDVSYTRAYLGEQSTLKSGIEAYAWRFAIVSGATAAVVGALAWWIWGRQAPGATTWIGIGTLLSVLIPMAQARARLQGDYRRLAVAVAAGTGVTVVANLAAGYLSWRSGVALVAGTVIGFAVILFLLGWPRGQGGPRPDARQRWAIFTIGLPSVITAPMHWVITSADRWFVVHFVGNAEAGVYAVAAMIGSAGAILNTAVISVWMPEATRLHESQGTAATNALGQLTARIILGMALGWLCTVALSDEAVRMLTARPFHAATAYVPWLAGGVFFLGVYHVGSTGLVFGRRLGPTAVIWLVVAAAAVAVSLVTVPRYGAMASARIQCVSMAVAAVLVIPLAMRQHPMPLPYIRLLLAVALTVLAGVAMSPAWLAQPLASLLLKLPCLAILAAAVVWIGDPLLLRQLKSRLQRSHG